MTRASPRSSWASTGTVLPARSSSRGWSSTPSSPLWPVARSQYFPKTSSFAASLSPSVRGPPMFCTAATASLQLRRENHGQKECQRGKYLQEETGRSLDRSILGGHPRGQNQAQVHLRQEA